MAAICTPEVGKRLLAALGLSGRPVLAVSLHFPAHGEMVASVEMHVQDCTIDEIISIVKQYDLVEREGGDEQ